VATGRVFYGAEDTNWTAFLALPVSRTNNLFFRLRSEASSDGSGLPDWWEQMYGVSDPYGDPDGDGWNNYQEMLRGTHPNQFDPPPAPQNLVITFDGASRTATVSWSPPPGPVTGYTVTRTYYPGFYDPDQNQTFNVSANTLSVHDLTPFSPYANDNPTIYVYYSIQANYAGGNSASAGQWLQQTSVPITPIPAADGSAMLTDFGLPPGSAGILLTRTDLAAEDNYGDAAYDTNYFIPLSAFTNGLFKIPAAWATPPVDGYGWNDYAWYVEPVNASGGAAGSAQELLGRYYLAANTVSLSPPFYDGRAQLKQDLIFQLRAATVSRTFAACPSNLNLLPGVVTSTNYVVSSYNLARVSTGATGNNWMWNGKNLHGDVLSPFKMNYYYRNFVFDPDALDAMGVVTNGVVFTGYDFWLLDSPAYQFSTPPAGMTNVPALLGTSVAQWLAPGGVDPADFGIGFDDDYQNAYLIDGARNYYGLPFVSEKIAQPTSVLQAFNDVAAGGAFSVMQNAWYMFPYPETAQPQFQTVEYDFWDAAPVWNSAAQEDQYTPLPGMADFSPASVSRQFYMAVGGQIQIAGYAKLAVANAYSGVYAYLGQYFDRAYKMTGGIATTNSTGILSPYGNFFATEPGAIALVTLPDVDTGERGTGIVHAVSLQLDANHDGQMDLNWNGPDAGPLTFWCNNNYDRGHTVDDNDFEQDDLSPKEVANGHLVPDCQYTANGQPAIPCTRDLEDYFRLWLPGVAAAMKAMSANYTVKLTLTGDAQIRLFQAIEPDGGTNYLFDEITASNQVANAASLYVGLLTSSSPIVFNITTNFNEHFIFCGAQVGGAQIDLQVLDENQNLVADAPVYLQIEDIKQMYERWTVGESATNPPMATATWQVDDTPFRYSTNVDETTPYILLVHGWNMETWEKDRYAETAYKRLYWQGYTGRFGIFHWPTGNGISDTMDAVLHARNYDNSEFQAWKSATGLTNLLTQLNAKYPGKVYLMVHSMGNVVAGEALRKASSQLVNTYIAMQGAVSAHAYDPTTTTRAIVPILLLGQDDGTPNRYASYYTNGAPCYFSSSAGAGTYVNFFNTNDYALSATLWQFNQNLKPDNATTPGYHYSSSSGFYKIIGTGPGSTTYLNFPQDTYEIFAYCDEARCFALGAQKDVGGVFKPGVAYQQVELNAAPYGFLDKHKYHSGEFRSDNAQRWQFWNQVLNQMGLQ
jgi:hypothetical protein